MVQARELAAALRPQGGHHQSGAPPQVGGPESGAVEALFTALALRDGFLPPTIHYQKPDPACDLDYIPNQGREQQVEYALSNSLGFGGHNACVLFKKWEG